VKARLRSWIERRPSSFYSCVVEGDFAGNRLSEGRLIQDTRIVMTRQLRSAFLFILLSVSGLCASASNHSTLQIDGVFKVQGAAMQHARVTLHCQDVVMEVLTNDVRHLNLRLELQTTYTLSFECPGQVTKKLFFDTRMSEEAAARGPYEFRFEVTLHPTSKDGMDAYAGPVGYIRFSGVDGGFDYDVDYRLTHTENGELLASASSGTAEMVSVSEKRDRRERRFIQPFIDPTKEMERSGVSRSYTQEGVAPSSAEVKRSVIVEQEREITIARMRINGVLTEYRQVKHENGTTMHYRNGSNCTFQEYLSAVGR
jgi:hypothetical protein